MKTTIAEYATDGPKISYEEIDASLLKPVKRDYTGGGAPQAGAASPAPPKPASPVIQGAH